MSEKVICAECGGKLVFWVDIDATINVSIESNGKLSKRTIKNNLQSDGRCGFECSVCDWELHANDVKSKYLLNVMKVAWERYASVELSEKRIRP